MTDIDTRAADLLDEAADRLETEGWVQHTLHAPNKGYCSLGAIGAVVGDLVEQRARTERHISYSERVGIEARLSMLVHGEIAEPDEHQAIVEQDDDSTADEDIAEWNDAPDRTKGQVIDAFRHAAKRARS